MRFTVPAIVLGLWVALAVPSPIREQDTSDIDHSKIILTGITFAGSGCPAGSVSLVPWVGRPDFALGFSKFIASIGPGIPIVENRKNCNINVNLHYPPDYQYTVYEFNFAGYAALDKGVKVTHQLDSWFAGFAVNKATLKRELVGPFYDSYNFHKSLDQDAWVWSPCNASTTLNLNTQIYLNNTLNPQGYGITAAPEVLNNTLKAVYGMQWRKCL